MDSITQFALGAAIGGAVGSKYIGRKAVLIGGLLATLPDLDVFFRHDDPVKDFTYHRSVTHSLFVLMLVTPFFAWLLHYFYKSVLYKTWCWFVGLCLITHALLDAMTIYGTQLFWPLAPSPTMIGSMFIVDPLYTLPLLVGWIALLIKPQAKFCVRTNHTGLWLSSCYLVLSLILQQYVIFKAKNYAQSQGVAVEKILATPTPFTISAWRVVVISNDYYHEGFYGLLPGTRDFSLSTYERRPELAAFVSDNWAFQRLRWFSSGFYKLGRDNDKIYVSDLRMGFEPKYSFSFFVAKRAGADYVEIPSQRYSLGRRGLSDLKPFWCEKLWLPGVKWCR